MHSPFLQRRGVLRAFCAAGLAGFFGLAHALGSHHGLDLRSGWVMKTHDR